MPSISVLSIRAAAIAAGGALALFAGTASAATAPAPAAPAAPAQKITVDIPTPVQQALGTGTTLQSVTINYSLDPSSPSITTNHGPIQANPPILPGSGTVSTPAPVAPQAPQDGGLRVGNGPVTVYGNPGSGDVTTCGTTINGQTVFPAHDCAQSASGGVAAMVGTADASVSPAGVAVSICGIAFELGGGTVSVVCGPNPGLGSATSSIAGTHGSGLTAVGGPTAASLGQSGAAAYICGVGAAAGLQDSPATAVTCAAYGNSNATSTGNAIIAGGHVAGSLTQAQGAALYICGVAAAAAQNASGSVACSDYRDGSVTVACGSPCAFGGLGLTHGNINGNSGTPGNQPGADAFACGLGAGGLLTPNTTGGLGITCAGSSGTAHCTADVIVCNAGDHIYITPSGSGATVCGYDAQGALVVGSATVGCPVTPVTPSLPVTPGTPVIPGLPVSVGSVLANTASTAGTALANTAYPMSILLLAGLVALTAGILVSRRRDEVNGL